ncbi:MAG: ATP-binding protein [Anaerolineales bacterium]
MSLEVLKKIPLFAGLSDEDFQRLCDMSRGISLAKGERLFEEGRPGSEAYVIESGQVEILKASAGREVLLAVRGPGEIIGEVALLEDAPRMASVRARTEARLIGIGKSSFDELLHSSSTALQALFRTTLSRLRSTQSYIQQSEKMAQLGTLTAGVAHELNNPASAIQRGEKQLHDELAALRLIERSLYSLDLTRDQLERLQQLEKEAILRASRPTELDALARSERAEEIEEWLSGHNLLSVLEQAGKLADLGFSVGRLDEIGKALSSEQIAVCLSWLAATYAVHSLLAEMGEGAKRISAIVKALKSYAYLDQAPIQSVEIKAGIEDTLLILGSKLRGGINVRREYASDLPAIQGYGSELNQVWTNILDNAIDAMQGKGQIKIRTRREGDWAIVEIEDNGPGIPKEMQSKVFDAFFTTKPPGKGTGLGLNISYNIIVEKHHGDIRLSSEPGRTNFEVHLPIR